ncbi:MAG: nicotinate phosphoribosyltransferase [Candidatus Omnitrophica bacterium]|nr:nicotinate phosphoribosyltransferase [Candidatus Omnitrophota bacterium]
MEKNFSALTTDFYELTMAQCYWRYKPNAVATFELFVRQLPRQRSFLIFSGLEEVIDFLTNLQFKPEEIAYLRQKGIFEDGFLDYLAKMRFSGDVWAMPEGTVFFAGEPVLRVSAPIIEAQLIESFLLSTINLQTMVASKAARVVLAAEGRPVYDFSLRRTHGPTAGFYVARAAYLGGCQGTSNVLAAKELGIPVIGTMAHSFVMAFADELESFKVYTQLFPKNSVLLVDTYDAKQGIKNALKIALLMQKNGQRLNGIRLDSGDIISLSKYARTLFNKHGLPELRIVASGNLDEYAIQKLLKKGACVDSFGVGTHLGTSFDAPALDAIYKLVEVSQENGEFLPTMKLSSAKVTLPGRKQIFRLFDKKGIIKKDVLALESERQKGTVLLRKVIERGHCIYSLPPLTEICQYAKAQIASLPSELKEITKTYPTNFVVEPTDKLEKLAKKTARDLARGIK